MFTKENAGNVNTRRVICALLMGLLLVSTPCHADAAGTAENKHYMGQVVNTGKDNGYSGSNEIDKDDPHFNWTLGKFYVNGYTRVVDGNTDNPVFLKNVEDKVTLWFDLQQNIDCLNGDEDLTIYSDENGYDEKYNIPKSNFGRGTLIIQYTDYQNNTKEPVVYRDFLVAKASLTADTTVELCEEGDYEVSLLYEIQKNGFWFADSYTNYRISFKFSVRNGNTMVFPFDMTTKQELTNSAFTENGFYLDLAKSRYLDIDIKKEILQTGADGLTEDTRFNRPAKDGEPFTDEGIYTITVTNKYTESTTVKKIYVGTNSVLKAHVVTGLSISDIEEKIASGAVINTDGTIVMPKPTPTPEPTAEPTLEPASEIEGDNAAESEDTSTLKEAMETEEIEEVAFDIQKRLPVCIVLGVTLLIVIGLVMRRQGQKAALREESEKKQREHLEQEDSQSQQQDSFRQYEGR